MRFMIIRKADPATEADAMPTAELITQMGRYMEEMAKAGILLAGDGLRSSRYGAKVRFHGGRPTVLDGPFAETKELVAGYSIIDVRSREEAIAWVKKWPALDGNGEVEVEIRQIFEAADFGENFTEEARARDTATRAEIANKTKG